MASSDHAHGISGYESTMVSKPEESEAARGPTTQQEQSGKVIIQCPAFLLSERPIGVRDGVLKEWQQISNDVDSNKLCIFNRDLRRVGSEYIATIWDGEDNPASGYGVSTINMVLLATDSRRKGTGTGSPHDWIGARASSDRPGSCI